MSRAKWKHSNITKDIISFFLINSKSSINKKTNLNHINSYIYYQPKNTFSFYLQNRTLQVTKLVFYLNKIFTFHIHNGKKYFPCYKTFFPSAMLCTNLCRRNAISPSCRKQKDS